MAHTAGVDGGSKISRVPVEVDVVGYNIARDSVLANLTGPMCEGRELSEFDANRRAVGTLNSIRDRKEEGVEKGTAPVIAACPEGR